MIFTTIMVLVGVLHLTKACSNCIDLGVRSWNLKLRPSFHDFAEGALGVLYIASVFSGSHA